MNKVWLLIGARGQGKSPFITGGDFEEGIAKYYLREHGMSTLTLDEIDHPRYRDVPTLNPKDYSKLSTNPGIYRTLCPLQHLHGLVRRIGQEKLVWNSNIVFEDSHKYIPMKFTKQEWALIGNSKQQNVNLFFMYWDWGLVPPDMFRVANLIVIFDTASSPECRKDLIPACFSKAMAAYNRVHTGKDKYLIVDTGI